MTHHIFLLDWWFSTLAVHFNFLWAFKKKKAPMPRPHSRISHWESLQQGQSICTFRCTRLCLVALVDSQGQEPLHWAAFLPQYFPPNFVPHLGQSKPPHIGWCFCLVLIRCLKRMGILFCFHGAFKRQNSYPHFSLNDYLICFGFPCKILLRFFSSGFIILALLSR